MPPKQKANPRKQALHDALSRARTTSATIPGILQGATAAMHGKAWTGGTSQEFGNGLSAHVTSAKSGGTNTVEEIQHAYDACPDTVPDQSGGS